MNPNSCFATRKTSAYGYTDSSRRTSSSCCTTGVHVGSDRGRHRLWGESRIPSSERSRQWWRSVTPIGTRPHGQGGSAAGDSIQSNRRNRGGQDLRGLTRGKRGRRYYRHRNVILVHHRPVDRHGARHDSHVVCKGRGVFELLSGPHHGGRTLGS